MLLTIPFVPSVPSYEFATQIEQVQYTFRVRWNTRAEAWYFDLLDDVLPILRGVRLSLGLFLGRECKREPFASGGFLVVDTTRQGREATFDDLGTRVEVRWMPNSEILARKALFLERVRR